MQNQPEFHWTAALSAVCFLASTGLAQDGVDFATVDVIEAEVGPNVGTQPRAARGVLGEAGEGDEIEGEQESRLYVGAGVDYTTAYYSRGLLYEDEGLILQPWLELSLEVWRGDEVTVSVIAGTWNSYQGEGTDAGTTDSTRENWYESDLYAGFGIATGNWYFEAEYQWYTSPSDAWDTVEELYFTAAYDDSEAMGAWSMQPTAVLAIETGDEANDGYATGTYLQLGVSPGVYPEEGAFEGWEITFPVSVGLSLSNYYEGDDGENDFFGFVSAGVTASRTLGLDESWGEWSVYGGIQALFLGDMTSTYNDGDDTVAILTLGVSIEF